MKSRRGTGLAHLAHMGEIRNAFKSLVRKCDGKRPTERITHK
jgi:hypothetical protein